MKCALLSIYVILLPNSECFMVLLPAVSSERKLNMETNTMTKLSSLAVTLHTQQTTTFKAHMQNPKTKKQKACHPNFDFYNNLHSSSPPTYPTKTPPLTSAAQSAR